MNLNNKIQLLAASIPLWVASYSQTLAQEPPPDPPVAAWGGWNLIARDGFSTTREKGTPGSADYSKITEIGNGLNHQDQNGEWKESLDLISLLPDGRAAATNGQHKLYFSADLSSGITIITKNGHVYRTLPMAICYYDMLSGKTMDLATLNDSAEAELLPPNQIIWKDAFASDSIMADVRVTYVRHGFECDVIVTRKPKSPQAFSLSPDAVQLQVRHAWFDVPEPKRTIKVLGPNLTDEVLDLDDLWFPTGSGFAQDGAGERDFSSPARMNPPYSPKDAARIPVGKTWQETAGKMSVLTESVIWSDVAPRLSHLPEMAAAEGTSKSTQIANGVGRLRLLQQTASTPRAVTIAAAPYDRHGFVLDYVTISGWQTGNFEFTQWGTFLIGGFTSIPGTTTFGAAATLKYTNGAALYLRGPVTCAGTDQLPTQLTSMNEDVLPLGHQRIDYSTGNPSYTAAEAIWLDYNVAPQTLHHLQIRWAQVAVQVDGTGSGLAHTLQNSSVEYCQTGAYINNCGLIVQNSRKCRVDTEYVGVGQYWGYSGSLSDVCFGNYNSDGNGIPDWWEYKYFGKLLGTTGANANPDGDMTSNLSEYLAGTNPIERPSLITTPVYQVVHVNDSSTPFQFTCTGAGPNYIYNWYHNGLQQSGPSPTLSRASAQFSDNGQWYLRVTGQDPQLYLDHYVRLVVCDDTGYAIWNNYRALTNGKSDVLYSTRYHTNDWPNVPPVVVWNSNSLLYQHCWQYGKKGFTAVSPCNSFEGSEGQVPVTALTRRHGYHRGHDVGPCPSGFKPGFAGRKVFFLTQNNQIVTAVVKNAILRNKKDCQDTIYDYTILLFEEDLPSSITPVFNVMAALPQTHAVCFRTCQLGYMSANMPPFAFKDDVGVHADVSIPYFNRFTANGGDSGSPNFIPAANGELIFVGGTSCSGGSSQMVTDINDLSAWAGLPSDPQYQINLIQ